MIDTKTCPFCNPPGSKHFVTMNFDLTQHWVSCDHCGATSGKRYTELAALEAWNTRKEETISNTIAANIIAAIIRLEQEAKLLKTSPVYPERTLKQAISMLWRTSPSGTRYLASPGNWTPEEMQAYDVIRRILESEDK